MLRCRGTRGAAGVSVLCVGWALLCLGVHVPAGPTLGLSVPDLISVCSFPARLSMYCFAVCVLSHVRNVLLSCLREAWRSAEDVGNTQVCMQLTPVQACDSLDTSRMHSHCIDCAYIASTCGGRCHAQVIIANDGWTSTCKVRRLNYYYYVNTLPFTLKVKDHVCKTSAPVREATDAAAAIALSRVITPRFALLQQSHAWPWLCCCIRDVTRSQRYALLIVSHTWSAFLSRGVWQWASIYTSAEAIDGLELHAGLQLV